MIKSILVIVLFMSSAVSAHELMLPIRGVTDGDTIKTVVTLPCPLCEMSVRINGIDTPESTTRFAQCEKEKLLGIQATEFLTSFVGDERFMVATNLRHDKYGGRILADVYVRGTNLADLLITHGFAAPYTGSGAKPDWCK